MMTRCQNGHKPFDIELWPGGCPVCMPADHRPRPAASGNETVPEGRSGAAQAVGSGGTQIMRGRGSERLVGWLVVVSGPQRDADFRLVEGDNDIGRRPNSRVRLQDANVSTTHAQISFENGAFEVVDLRSSNGTFLNDNPKKIIRETLQHGDLLRVGDTTLKLVRYE